MSYATEWRTVARRAGDGVEVMLLWNESLHRVKVAVSDAHQCHHVDLELADGNEPGGFYLPFADVASRLSRERLDG